MPELAKFILINILITILWLIVPFSIQLFVDKVVLHGLASFNYIAILFILIVLASAIAIGCERILARFASRFASSESLLKKLILYVNFSRLLLLFLILFCVSPNFGFGCMIATILVGAILWKFSRRIKFKILLFTSSREILIFASIGIGFSLLTVIFVFLFPGLMGSNLLLYMQLFSGVLVIIFSVMFWLLREKLIGRVGTRISPNGALTLLMLYAQFSLMSFFGIFFGIMIVLACIAFIFAKKQTLSKSEFEFAVDKLVTFLSVVAIIIFELIKTGYGALLVVKGSISFGQLFLLVFINFLIVETIVCTIAIFHNHSLLSQARTDGGGVKH